MGETSKKRRGGDGGLESYVYCSPVLDYQWRQGAEGGRVF